MQQQYYAPQQQYMYPQQPVQYGYAAQPQPYYGYAPAEQQYVVQEQAPAPAEAPKPVEKKAAKPAPPPKPKTRMPNPVGWGKIVLYNDRNQPVDTSSVLLDRRCAVLIERCGRSEADWPSNAHRLIAKPAAKPGAKQPVAPASPQQAVYNPRGREQFLYDLGPQDPQYYAYQQQQQPQMIQYVQQPQAVQYVQYGQQ